MLGNNFDIPFFRLDIGIDVGDAKGGRNLSLLKSERDLDNTRYRTRSLAVAYAGLDLTWRQLKCPRKYCQAADKFLPSQLVRALLSFERLETRPQLRSDLRPVFQSRDTRHNRYYPRRGWLPYKLSESPLLVLLYWEE